MQGQHQHAEDVFPKKGRGKQVAAKNHFLPNTTSHHDGVEGQGLEHNRVLGSVQALAGDQKPQYQAQAEQENQKLKRREHPLHQGPDRCVTPNSLLGRVKRAGRGHPRLGQLLLFCHLHCLHGPKFNRQIQYCQLIVT